MRRRFTRLAVGTALAVGSLGALGVFGLPAAHATGPAGTTCQGSNGFIAAGSLTDGPNPAIPPAPSTNCASFVEPAGSGGGWVGGDSVLWTVTTSIYVAQDNNKQPCG